jgi:glyoxylase-like metal-dependent hydrolase (beta-lactamase superfamily II)
METVELLPGLLYMFRFGLGQAYLWRDRESLTLIDAGPPGHGAAIAAALGTLGLRPGDLDRVILTHFHADHIGSAAGVAAQSGAAVLAHRWDAFGHGDPVLADGSAALREAAERQSFRLAP